MSARILVTGATGHTGSFVAAQLGERGGDVRLATRRAPADDPGHVRFDWADERTHDGALDGVTAAYLVAPAHVTDPAPLMEAFVTRALRHGVRRFVLLSSSAITEDMPGLGAVARLVRERAPEWAVLRPSWFMQNFTDLAMPHARSLRDEGRVRSSTGAGRIGFVDAADIAAVAVSALTAARAPDAPLVITGPEALSYDDIARIMGAVLGRSFEHVRITDEQAGARLEAAGMSASYASMLVALDAGIRQGSEDRVTDTVRAATGRDPRSFEAFLRAHGPTPEGWFRG